MLIIALLQFHIFGGGLTLYSLLKTVSLPIDILLCLAFIIISTIGIDIQNMIKLGPAASSRYLLINVEGVAH